MRFGSETDLRILLTYTAFLFMQFFVFLVTTLLVAHMFQAQMRFEAVYRQMIHNESNTTLTLDQGGRSTTRGRPHPSPLLMAEMSFMYWNATTLEYWRSFRGTTTKTVHASSAGALSPQAQ